MQCPHADGNRIAEASGDGDTADDADDWAYPPYGYYYGPPYDDPFFFDFGVGFNHFHHFRHFRLIHGSPGGGHR